MGSMDSGNDLLKILHGAPLKVDSVRKLYVYMVSNVFSCVRKQTSNVQKLFCSVLRTVCKHCFNGFSTLFGPPPKNIIQACADDFSSSDVIFGVHDGMFLRSLWNYDSSGWNALKLRSAHAQTAAACAVWTWPLAAPWLTGSLLCAHWWKRYTGEIWVRLR